MALPQPWLDARYALLHGEDSDGRAAAVAAWKAVHVDPEWEVFSFTVCAEGCPWPEVLNALCESAPLGADRVVLVPQADNLLEKAKELPPAVKQALQAPAARHPAAAGGPGRPVRRPRPDPGRQALQRLGPAGPGAEGGRPGREGGRGLGGGRGLAPWACGWTRAWPSASPRGWAAIPASCAGPWKCWSCWPRTGP